MSRSKSSTSGSQKFAATYDWLAWLDKVAKGLKPETEWLQEPDLASQRCRRFIMTRFPALVRPIPKEVLVRELIRGNRKISDSKHAARVLRGLNLAQRLQLAGLVLDIAEALEFHKKRRESSRMVHELAAEADRRMRMLSRKLSSIRSALEKLQKYAQRLDRSLSLDYIRAVDRCLKILAAVTDGASVGEYFRSVKNDYPPLEAPGQLGIVELYWFFRHECRCNGSDSEVRVGMIANDFLGLKLKYLPEYRDAESQGCQAVRRAVSRFRPRTVSPKTA